MRDESIRENTGTSIHNNGGKNGAVRSRDRVIELTRLCSVSFGSADAATTRLWLKLVHQHFTSSYDRLLGSTGLSGSGLLEFFSILACTCLITGCLSGEKSRDWVTRSDVTA